MDLRNKHKRAVRITSYNPVPPFNNCLIESEQKSCGGYN